MANRAVVAAKPLCATRIDVGSGSQQWLKGEAAASMPVVATVATAMEQRRCQVSLLAEEQYQWYRFDQP